MDAMFTHTATRCSSWPTSSSSATPSARAPSSRRPSRRRPRCRPSSLATSPTRSRSPLTASPTSSPCSRRRPRHGARDTVGARHLRPAARRRCSGEKAGCATSLELLTDLAASLLGTRDVARSPPPTCPPTPRPRRRGAEVQRDVRAELSAMAGPVRRRRRRSRRRLPSWRATT